MRHFKKIDWSISLFLFFACVLTVIAACVEPSGPLGAPNVVVVRTVSSVQITLAQSTLVLGQTTQATVVATSADGNVVSGRVDFSSQNPSVATVSSNGVVTALTAGVAVIQAIVASRAASATVTVESLVSPVAVVAVALDSTSLAIGHSAKASATAKDSAGNLITGQTVTWASLSPTVATVASTGTVTAVAAGSATIQGTVSGKAGSASLTVLPVPAAAVSVVVVEVDSTTLLVGHLAQASATAKDAMGNPITGQQVTWASLTPGIATVSSSGAVTAVAPGPAIIQASVSGITGLDTLVVVVPPDLAFHNFDDGTKGPFADYNSPAVTYPVDPTGSGRGKVASIRYASATGSADRIIEFNYPRGYGQPIYFKGDFYIAATDLGGDSHSSNMYARKLIYWKSHTNYGRYPLGGGGVNMRTVVGLYGNKLSVDATFNPAVGDGNSDTFRRHVEDLATITGNTWYTLEVFQQMETVSGLTDGRLTVWLNGIQIYDMPNYFKSRWTDPNWVGATGDYLGVWSNPPTQGVLMQAEDIYFNVFQFGAQFDNHAGDGLPFDEYRYWDNVGFSTTRIGR